MDSAVFLPTQVKERDVSGNTFIIHSQVKGKKSVFSKVRLKQKIKVCQAFLGGSKEDPQKGWLFSKEVYWYVPLPPHVCYPLYKSCKQDESAQLTQLHSQGWKILLETTSNLSVLLYMVLDLSCDTRMLPSHSIGERQLLQSFKGKISTHHGFLLAITQSKPRHTTGNDNPVVDATEQPHD